jgi:hypothetical protein
MNFVICVLFPNWCEFILWLAHDLLSVILTRCRTTPNRSKFEQRKNFVLYVALFGICDSFFFFSPGPPLQTTWIVFNDITPVLVRHVLEPFSHARRTRVLCAAIRNACFHICLSTQLRRCMCFTIATHSCVATHSPTNSEKIFWSKNTRLPHILVTCFLITMCLVDEPHDFNVCHAQVFFHSSTFTPWHILDTIHRNVVCFNYVIFLQNT